MHYTEIHFNQISEQRKPIVIAFLSELQFESFEDQNGLSCFIQSNLFSQKALDEVCSEYSIDESYQIIEHKKENWNKNWERNITPIMIDDICQVRCDFHQKNEQLSYDIVINPKMSFGTGHHQTTRLMLQNMLKLEIKDAEVLDMGCGTGVLGILALLKQAKHVNFVDIDDWAIENTKENIKKNTTNTNYKTFIGGIEQLDGEKNYDLILSNITKNINLEYIESYRSITKQNAKLVLSGFYITDKNDVVEKAKAARFDLIETKQEDNWIALCFQKQ